MANMRFFATAAKGTESLVAQELAVIGAQNSDPLSEVSISRANWKRSTGRTSGSEQRIGC